MTVVATDLRTRMKLVTVVVDPVHVWQDSEEHVSQTSLPHKDRHTWMYVVTYCEQHSSQYSSQASVLVTPGGHTR